MRGAAMVAAAVILPFPMVLPLIVQAGAIRVARRRGGP